MLFLHCPYELNKAVWPVGHFRIMLTVREANVFTGRLGRLLLVDCEFVEFGYEPFVFIDYVSRCHDSLLGNCCGFAFAGPREHRIPVRGAGDRHFLLENVPVLEHLAALDAEDVHGDHGLRTPAGIASVDHDEVTLGNRHTRLVAQIREGRDHLRDGCWTVRNCRVVLLVVDAEELFDNRRIPVCERACQNFEGNLFVGFGHWGSQLSKGALSSRSHTFGTSKPGTRRRAMSPMPVPMAVKGFFRPTSASASVNAFLNPSRG